MSQLHAQALEMPAEAGAAPACVHDLLALRDASALRWEGVAPDWAPGAVAAAPWVVVRRAAPRAGRLAVGVRGPERWQRAAAWLEPAQVLRRHGPAELRARARQLPEARAALAVFRTLQRLEQAWHASGPAYWGPGGSVGFELASGCVAAGPASDLDVVVRCPRAPSPAQARAWLRALPEAPEARIDVVLEWPAGGAALAEFAASGSYLLRTPHGARLRRRAGVRQPEAEAA